MKFNIMHNKLWFTYLSLLLLQSLYVEIYSQEPATNSMPSIQLIARPLKDSITLRWAPTDYATWVNGNQYGYRIFRTTITKDSFVLTDTKPVELTSFPIKPKPIEQWKELVNQNKYAPVAAQALFGDTIRITAGNEFNPAQAYSEAQEQSLRFSIALYAADLSPEVANASGLRFVDKTALPDEKYLYSVFQAIPIDSLIKTDTAYIFTGISLYKPLPAPVELNATFGDKEVVISWNALIYNNIYIAYMIEKSSDGGKTYVQVNSDPITNIIPQTGSVSDRMQKFDSLQQNGKEYFYRVRGISYFGETGPYSNPIGGKGKNSISASPVIKKYEFLKERVKIYWEFPSTAEKEISCFKIMRSENDQTGFKPINENVNRGIREYTDNLPLATGYYKVVAWHDSTILKESFPILVQLVDSTPPLKPEGLKGSMDTSGLVKLIWTPNKEKDLFGYRVFRSESENAEYSQLTNWPLNEPTYTDSLSIKNLNKKVFYRIMAVDQRQNQSELSKVLELIKPDIIPPSAPVFKNISAHAKGVQVDWLGSSSNDVISHILYRRYSNDSAWIKINEFTSNKKNQQFSYLDNLVEPGKTIEYKVEAIDESLNHSKPAISIEVNTIKPALGETVTELKQSIDDQNGKIKISWKTPEAKVQYYWVYRKTPDNAYSLYETVPGSENSFTDKGMKAGNKYYYRIKVVYKDKTISPFSEELVFIF